MASRTSAAVAAPGALGAVGLELLGTRAKGRIVRDGTDRVLDVSGVRSFDQRDSEAELGDASGDWNLIASQAGDADQWYAVA